MSKNISYLQCIPGLLVPGNISYDSFEAVINEFIDKAPDMVKKTEDYHAQKKKDLFVETLESIQSYLKGVYAQYLESECRILLRRAKYEFANISPTDVKLFATNLSALSVEMQKAQRHSNEQTGVNSQDAIESLSDSFVAIEKLINDSKYGIAQSLLTYIDERTPEPLLDNLLELVTQKRYSEVEVIAESLKEKHLNMLNEFTRTISPKKIMAVDDRPEVLSFINSVLKKHYKLFCATEGSTALKILESQEPDLFILDIDMPDMDGYELATHIRMLKSHAKTPIIFLAGNSSRDYILKAMEVGGNDFIVKPATGELLLRKVAEHL